MKTFVVFLKNKTCETLTNSLLTKHVHFLQNLQDTNRLISAGPFSDNKNAILLLRASDIQETNQIIQSDPFIKEHYYKAYEVHEFYEASAENHWLMKDSQTLGNLS